jgi:hypothetical protein
MTDSKKLDAILESLAAIEAELCRAREEDVLGHRLVYRNGREQVGGTTIDPSLLKNGIQVRLTRVPR